MNDRFYLEYQTHFDAAHFLRGYDGPCCNLHGHRWEVQLCVSGIKLNKDGILVDFKDLKKMLGHILPDHRCLNDLAEFKEKNPTAENLARFFFNRIEYHLDCKPLPSAECPLRLERVRVYESPGACALVERGL